MLKSSTVSLMLAAGVLAGCTQTTGPVANTGGQAQPTATTAAAEALQEPSSDGLRPRCSFPSTTSSFNLTSRFYTEQRKIVPLGEVVTVGQPLFYALYHDTTRYAIADEHIVNRDPSPLNPNWAMGPGQQYQVIALYSHNGSDYYYLIDNQVGISPSMWVSDMSGMLCSNGISVRRGVATNGGMPRVYQTLPLRFETVAALTDQPRSVAITVKELNGATVTLELTAIAGGRSLKKALGTFDVFAGTADFAGLRFEFDRSGDGIRLNSVVEPVNTERWLAFELGMLR